ncbi:ABC transporter substrate-binding protein [Bowmanella pacifica]|uniref:ABC transporter substrate-binding protein n=1 Tax=Bowmanella pacifica TaxID=502051 RepID=UPI003570A738
MKKLMSWVAMATLVLSSQVMAQDQEDPYQLLSSVATKTFDRIKSERVEIKANPEILRDIMEQELLPYIDYKFAALKVLGKHFKSVPRERIPEYVQVFRDYLVTTYALAMAQYDNQTVEFEPNRGEVEEERVVTVRALVKEAGRPDIKLAFKVRKSNNTDQWKAYDMVAEGISMLSSKQSELEGIIRQDGIDAVIKLMKEKNAQPISLQKNTEESA